MSTWGTLEATFVDPLWNVEGFRRQFAEREAPTGSEDGPSIGQGDDGEVWVQGRLRDVSDMADSAEVLGWFCYHAEYAKRATLMWEVDDGPRYRYVAQDGVVTKLKGILDQ